MGRRDDRLPLGCPSWVDLDDAGLEQLRLAHELRNELVAIEQRYQVAVQAIWRLYPQIVEADGEVQRVQAELDAPSARAAEERRIDRSKRPRLETRRSLALVRRGLRDAKAVRREAKALHYPQAKRDLLIARESRDSTLKSLYGAFRQQGLHWATYNDVVHSFHVMLSRIATQRRQGRAAEVRFRRWDGSGTLTVQLQREADMQARTFEVLSSGGGPWRNYVQFWSEERTRPRHQQERTTSKHWEMRFQLGPQTYAQLPVVVDRKPADDADITHVRITRRRIAGRHRLSVTLTARIPRPLEPEGALICARVGCRSLGTDLRVAVVVADRELAAPPGWLPVHAIEGGWEVRLPSALVKAHVRTDELRSRRDTALHSIRQTLAGWLEDQPQPDLDPEEVRQWRSPSRMAEVAFAWRNKPPANGWDIAKDLEVWRQQDRRLWERAANERDQVSARVGDLWANVAAWLNGQARLLVMDDAATELADDQDSVRAWLAKAVQEASPGKLRTRLRSAAQARGVHVTALSVRGEVDIHCGCGTELMGRATSKPYRWCPSCEEDVDQDLNAVQHLLSAAIAPPVS